LLFFFFSTQQTPSTGGRCVGVCEFFKEKQKGGPNSPFTFLFTQQSPFFSHYPLSLLLVFF
ncbi:hypothetical protein J4U37_24790, partial [Escherichia coli]